MKRRLSLGLMFACLLIGTFIYASAWASAPEAPPPAPPAQSPQLLPAILPVFQLMGPVVNQGSAEAIGRGLPGIGANAFMTATTFAGGLSFRSVNTQTGTLLEQFGATGGFFATNFGRAFAETPALLDYSPSMVCDFLAGASLFPKDFAQTEVTNCAGPLGYRQTPIYLSILTPTMGVDGAINLVSAPAASELIQTGVVFQVPLAVNVGVGAPMYMPLGGPGGHLSLLLTGFGDQESLNLNLLPGVNAIASPMNGRSIQKTIGSYPVISEQQAINQLRGVLPPGAVITPGHPGLAYYVDHPAVTQTVLMPTWVFTDAQALVGGEVVDLKGLTLPGVDGFLPDVHIVTPGPGAVYFPGHPLMVTANISGTAGPFTYTLAVDGGDTLASGVAPSGTLQLPLASVPFPLDKGSGDNVGLRLTVIDGNGAEGEAGTMLTAPLFVYLPLVQRSAAGASTVLVAVPAAQAPGLAPAAIGFTMGTEWIRYYNGTNPDLAGVPPDAAGFYTGLLSRGWNGRFNYGNNNAWEKDWRDCSLGGIDCTYGVDRAEFAYFSGHGSPARLYFGVNKDSYSFWGGNARFQNIRWAAFSSCQTLRGGPYVGPGNPPLTDWFNSFKGSYMLLGFHSNMADVAFGGPLVDNMRLPLWLGVVPQFSAQASIREAWTMTAFQMGAGQPAYLYAVGNINPVNYKLPDPLWAFAYPSTNPLTGIYQFRWVWWD